MEKWHLYDGILPGAGLGVKANEPRASPTAQNLPD